MSNSPDTQRTTQDPNDFLMGGGVPSASFVELGASVSGVVCEAPMLTQQREMQTNALKVWDDGSPMMQLVVTLQTDEHDNKIEDDDGRRRIYVKFNLKKAIADAVRKAGAKALEIGGKLSVAYTSTGEVTKRGFSPPKFYTASYVPPTANFLDDDREETAQGKPATNGHWLWSVALAEAARAGISESLLKAELKSRGLSAYNAERDTVTVKKIIAAKSVISEEKQFEESDIPF